MKAFVTYTKPASDRVQLEVDKLNIWVEENKYLYSINWYAQKDVSDEADRFVTEAKQKLDASMKGWSPVKEGAETHYQIHHTKDGIEYSYTRHYTK